MCQGRLKGVLGVLERSSKGSFKSLSRAYVSSVFQGCFKGVSKKIEGRSERPARVIQGRFKGIK